MTIATRIPKTEARRGALLMGCLWIASYIALLGEGYGYLFLLLPLAVLNFIVGALASERLARVIVVTEVIALLVVLLSCHHAA
jgi:hypothetical protein